MSEQKWLDILWLVCHGESAGNVARDTACNAGLGIIDIVVACDVDVPLSELRVYTFTPWPEMPSQKGGPAGILGA